MSFKKLDLNISKIVYGGRGSKRLNVAHLIVLVSVLGGSLSHIDILGLTFGLTTAHWAQNVVFSLGGHFSHCTLTLWSTWAIASECKDLRFCF